jgi:hypothetical protein
MDGGSWEAAQRVALLTERQRSAGGGRMREGRKEGMSG